MQFACYVIIKIKDIDFIPPITLLVIPTNRVPSYSNQFRRIGFLLIPTNHVSPKQLPRHMTSRCSVTTLQAAGLQTSHHAAIKSIPNSTEALQFLGVFSKFWKLKIFLKFWALSGALAHPFLYSLVAWNLTTTDVSTTFYTAFFTVMPKGLTIGPKSMSGYTYRVTVVCGLSSSTAFFLIIS